MMITRLIAFLLIPCITTGVTLTSVDTYKIKDVTLVTIYGDDTLQIDNFYLSNPPRIVFDFYNAVPKLPSVIPVNLPPLTRLRVGYPTIKPNATRIVMDVTNIQGYSVLERDTSITVGVVPLHVEKLYPKEITKLRKAPLITLDLTNADIRNVLKMLADRYNLNIVISEAVTGFITVHLKKVTPLEAFQSILQAAGCTFVESEGILIVKPLAETHTIEMDTRIFKLEYLDATDAKESIKNLLSPNGKIDVLYHTYTKEGKRSDLLLVTDIPTNLEKIARVLKEMDKPLPQVSIEAKFIETRLTKDEAMGIDWSMRLRMAGVTAPLPLIPAMHWEEMTIATLSPAELTALLEILQREGRSRLLSNPHVATLENQTAVITVGTTVPIRQVMIEPTTGREIVTYVERYIPISLKVTPRISEDKYITMTITPSVEEIVEWRGPPGEERPVTSKREATTQITVRDGETITIGGLIKEDRIKTTGKIPILGDIPILGRLFCYDKVEKKRSELLILITPHILSR